jgi:hypothetical protein
MTTQEKIAELSAKIAEAQANRDRLRRDLVEARIRRAKAGVPILQKPTLLNRAYLWLAKVIAGKQDDDRSDGMGVGQ